MKETKNAFLISVFIANIPYQLKNKQKKYYIIIIIIIIILKIFKKIS